MAKFVQINGLDAINRKLAGLEPKLAKKGIRKAVRQALGPVRDAVKAALPVGETGNLKRSVKIRSGKSRKGISMRVVIGADSFKKAFYGAFRDLGTKKLEGSEAMRRAFDATKEAAKTNAERLILDEVEKALKS